MRYRPQSLDHDLRTLAEAAAAVRVAIVEDRPEDAERRADHTALTRLVDCAEDLADSAAQAASAADDGRELATIHRLLLAASRVLRDEMLSLDGRFDHASRASKPWGQPWHAWAGVVHAGLVDAREATARAEHSLLTAWGARSAGAGPRISVRANGVLVDTPRRARRDKKGATQ